MPKNDDWEVLLPAVNLVLPKSMSPERRKAVSEGVHDALVEDFGVPKTGRFHIVSSCDDVLMDENFLGIPRTESFAFIHIFVMEGRGDDEKRNLIRKIRANLLAEALLKPEDLLINIVESPKQNWFCMVK